MNTSISLVEVLAIHHKLIKAYGGSPDVRGMRALHALKSSSLALDVYMWLTHRTFYLLKPQYLSWAALENQMGANYKEIRKFRTKVRNVIKKYRFLA